MVTHLFPTTYNHAMTEKEPLFIAHNVHFVVLNDDIFK